MPKRMLIDASHPEETRVVVLDGSKVEEFDFEAASKRPLKGNIYLAKVTRVEPSLQAAFVEYGGNRQGFLAFSEIHPDYYQIPVADRLALLADQSRRLMADDESFEAVRTARPAPGGPSPASEEPASEDSEEEEDEDEEEDEEQQEDTESESEELAAERAEANLVIEGEIVTETASGRSGDNGEPDVRSGLEEEGLPQTEHAGQQAEHAEETADEDSRLAAEPGTQDDAVRVQAEATGAPVPHQRRERHRAPRRRQYKIQEVIKRRQVMLVQVVKEERGNKGASLTTFLSLAGRYCVLMPNTPRGGGISRKITSATDRRRLKSAAQSLELPEGMGLIIRTAGANRTKVEIKRDYEYLLRLWDSVRELTLKSNAPALVYEEGNLIKRAIRDLYSKDIGEIQVDGDGGYRDAKEFMRMLMPSHAKNVKPYKEALPLFQRFGVEAQLDAMFSPTVTLKSGGYIVINQTEALVSIDVNSGKATREHSIEDTAHKTNLEAADEIARQLRLRDLAGLIVIDFIDMEDGKNDRNVEKRIRDAVRGDRARVQIGKISQFGLLEMSRQRLRAGVIAGSTVTCPHCAGVGLVRSTESAALRLLRALDEEGQRQPAANFTVKAPEDIIIYTLNQKRREVARIEDAYDLAIIFEPQAGMAGGSFEIERTGTRTVTHHKPAAVSFEGNFHKEEAAEGAEEVTLAEPPSHTAEESVEAAPHAPSPDNGGTNGGMNGQGGKRRRRRRRRGGRGRGPGAEGGTEAQHAENAEPHAAGEWEASDDEGEGEGEGEGEHEAEHDETSQTAAPQAQEPRGEEADKKRRRRRRGRRGRHNGETASEHGNEAQNIAASGERHDNGPAPAEIPGAASAEREADLTLAAFGIAPNMPSSPQWSLTGEEASASAREDAPAAGGRSDKPTFEADDHAEDQTGADAAMDMSQQSDEPRKGGWWQRRFKA